MAKQSIVQIIRAKPNARGKTSHIPFPCGVKKCQNDYFAITGSFANRKKVCKEHFYNPPKQDNAPSLDEVLKQLGLI